MGSSKSLKPPAQKERHRSENGGEGEASIHPDEEAAVAAAGKVISCYGRVLLQQHSREEHQWRPISRILSERRS